MDPTNCGKVLKRRGYQNTFCLLRNLYTGQEATVRTRHGAMDWFQTGKGVKQGYILSPCLFNLHTEYIMWNPRLDESQAGIKVSRRNSNNLRDADDSTIIAESEKELKRFLMTVNSWWVSEVTQSCTTLRPHGLESSRLLHPYDFPSKSTGVGCHLLLQGIFPTQGSNPGLLYCRQTLYPLSHQGSIATSIIQWNE